MIVSKFFNFSQRWQSFLIIALVTFAAYFASLSGGFVWDDSMNISSNTFIHDWKNFPLIFTRQYLTSPDKLHLIGQEMVGAGEASYRPVVTVTYFLDHTIWKLNPFGYHLTSLILHILCAWLVFIFLGYFLRDPGACLAAALIFAVHPVQTEAVISPAMREDLLVTLFYLLTVIFYIQTIHRSPPPSLPHRGGGIGRGLVTYTLALFSKEMAVTLPIMLWVIDAFLGKEKFCLQTVFHQRYWGFYAITFFYLIIWKFVMGRAEGFGASYPGGSFYTNILNMIKVAGIYGEWLINPWAVHPTLPTGSDFIVTSFWNPQVLASLLMLLGIILAVMVVSRKIPFVLFAASWVLITLIPVMNILPLQNIYAARFLYLPMAGVALGFGLLVEALFEQKLFRFNRDFLATSLIFVVLFYSAVTYAQHFRWKDEFSFRWALAQDYPMHLSARIGLAQAYRDQKKNSSRAIEQFLIAKAIDPNYLQTYIDLAGEYGKLGDSVSAANILREAVDHDPHNVGLRDMLCAVEGNAGRFVQAVECFENILNFDPYYFKSYGDLQKCYLLMGRPKAAAVVGIRFFSRQQRMLKDRSKK